MEQNSNQNQEGALLPIITVNPNDIISAYHLHIRTSNAEDMVINQGYAVVSFRGDSTSSERRATFKIPLYKTYPYKWGGITSVIPFVTIATISNEGRVGNAMWGVDNSSWNWDLVNRSIFVLADVAVRDTDGEIIRICFNVTILGDISSSLDLDAKEKS